MEKKLKRKKEKFHLSYIHNTGLRWRIRGKNYKASEA